MLIPGTVLQGRYRIIRQIGGGGQALVYLAEDTNLGSLRAIKELTPDPNASPQERQVAYDQFQREAQILAGLNHPNLARVWDHFRVGGNAYLVMDYIDGQTLQEIVDQTSGFLPEAAVLRWAGQLCDVLDYLHRQHPPIIFRDLKPSNVMLDRSDTVKLIDFGIVRHFKAGKTADTVSMGTPGYAPLEQHGQGQTDARSDIYALGATLYHLLTRHEPEPAPARVLPGQPDPLRPARVHNPKIRPTTEAGLAKAMAVDPNQRFQSALEMKQALLGALTAPTPAVTIPRPAARRGIEFRWPLLGLAAVFVVLIWFLMGRGEPGPRPTPTVVLATSTATPPPGLTASRTPTPMPTHTAAPTPTSQPPTPTATPTPTLQPPTPTATPTLTPEPPIPTKALPTVVPGREQVWEKDGSVMVYVPAGEFLMGSPEGEGDYDEHPQHTVYLSAFWIDQTEVTNEQFARFVDATGYSTDAEKGGWGWGRTGSEWKQIEGTDWRHPDGPETNIADKMDHPVVQISWNDAHAYCQWAGKRLPTEAEWEKAARGTEGRKYPWGETFDSSRLNFCDANCEFDHKDSGADDGYQRTAPVASYPAGASPCGALDMAGNVWEWCLDWYDANYYARSPQRHPQGPDSGWGRVLRGGSWDNTPGYLRSADRFGYWPAFRFNGIGFRCAQGVD